MIPVQPFRLRLANELDELEQRIGRLQSRATMGEMRNEPGSQVVFMGDCHYWEALPIAERDLQRQILQRYRRWLEVFSRCYSTHSTDIRIRIDTTAENVTKAIELSGGWWSPRTHQQHTEELTKELSFFRELLGASSEPPQRTLVVDTNALIVEPDPSRYREIAGYETFHLVITPTVLAELDRLKMNRRDDVGEKAKKLLQRLKGYRAQGAMPSGVRVNHTISVRMIATEPRMSDLPSWLDPENADDRIVGSTLEVQFSEPSAEVVLVTNDLNLQNKAEMAFLPWAEPPEREA